MAKLDRFTLSAQMIAITYLCKEMQYVLSIQNKQWIEIRLEELIKKYQSQIPNLRDMLQEKQAFSKYVATLTKQYARERRRLFLCWMTTFIVVGLSCGVMGVGLANNSARSPYDFVPGLVLMFFGIVFGAVLPWLLLGSIKELVTEVAEQEKITKDVELAYCQHFHGTSQE